MSNPDYPPPLGDATPGVARWVEPGGWSQYKPAHNSRSCYDGVQLRCRAPFHFPSCPKPSDKIRITRA